MLEEKNDLLVAIHKISKKKKAISRQGIAANGRRHGPSPPPRWHSHRHCRHVDVSLRVPVRLARRCGWEAAATFAWIAAAQPGSADSRRASCSTEACHTCTTKAKAESSKRGATGSRETVNSRASCPHLARRCDTRITHHAGSESTSRSRPIDALERRYVTEESLVGRPRASGGLNPRRFNDASMRRRCKRQNTDGPALKVTRTLSTTRVARARRVASRTFSRNCLSHIHIGQPSPFDSHLWLTRQRHFAHNAPGEVGVRQGNHFF